ncbi:MAG TPA: c-type cytochrome [Roseiarcus sp.]|jgi:mono/diheme cytochrome c family protein|nr:c-type cytochrome [Roseiarcus sp.]
MRQYAFTTALVSAAAALAILPARADDAQNARGKYLVIVAGCSDCHTPGALLGAPDMKRYLGGSDVGFAIPGLGVAVGENLTPDKETGLGDWTSAQIIAAIRTGKTPEGRDLSPVMPFAAFSHLADEDAEAIAAFLKSLPPVSNKVRNFGPKEPVTVSVSAILPPAVYNALPAAQK